MIEPWFEIFVVFIFAFGSYFVITQGFIKIFIIFTIILFVASILIAFSNDDVITIVTNFAFFIVGIALGVVGSLLFKIVLKPLLNEIM